MTERRVVVTGIGTINPLGNNIEEYFSNLEKGVSGAAPITHFDAEKFKTKFACEVKNYDSSLYFDRKEVRKYDLFTQYALIAATQAVEDSGLDLETVDKEQVGVIWSSGIGGIKSFFDECLGWAAGDGTPRNSRRLSISRFRTRTLRRSLPSVTRSTISRSTRNNFTKGFHSLL